MNDFVTSRSGIELIKKHEGVRLLPYLCPAGVPTIGYGNTFYPGGSRVTMQDPPLSRTRADELLREILLGVEIEINSVPVRLNQNQFDALVSFVYNIGVGAWRKSSARRHLLARRFDAVPASMALWNKGGGKVLPGLTRRRAEEGALFSKVG